MVILSIGKEFTVAEGYSKLRAFFLAIIADEKAMSIISPLLELVHPTHKGEVHRALLSLGNLKFEAAQFSETCYVILKLLSSCVAHTTAADHKTS